VEDLHLSEAWDRYELLIPILRQQQVAAYIFVGGLRSDFDRQQLIPFLSSLANTLIGAVENRRLQAQRVADAAVRKEIEIAQEVQAMLFPRKLPNDSHLAIERSYVPHTEIGGDYYDVVEIDADRLLLCVADVSGKGVPASLLMSNFQAGLRTLLRQGVELATIVPELNHLLFRNSGGEKFITAFLGIYDRRTRCLHYVNAGHNDPLLIADDGSVQALKHGTVMLGIMEELPLLHVGEVQITPRSLLLLYTDGLTEVFDAQSNEFGEEGVLDVLHRNRYLPLSKLHQELLSSINAFSAHDAQFADDVTILSCRFK
jgi:sigma-B regulation protein RsbU (phosphoserine phosphatase)